MHAEKHENEVLHIRFVHNAYAEESCFCTYVFFLFYNLSSFLNILSFHHCITVILSQTLDEKKNERKINSRWLETHQKKTSASFVLELRKILSMKCSSCRQKIWSSLHSRSFVDTRIHEYTKIHEETWIQGQT